jgi:hypothetical protein
LPLTQDQAYTKIRELISNYNAVPRERRKEVTEATVVHQFLDRFFKALNWPIDDPARYKYEQSTYAGRPDMMLIPEQGGTIFVEAKRFEMFQALRQARRTLAGIITPGQLALPGMAADRTKEEQQAINYAFENGGTWAILTNFEKLRLFNARRDWLVLSFETPSAYLDDFDLLWQLSYECICSGRLDALSNQRYREDVDTDYLAFINEWRERLAQDIVAYPDDNPWAFSLDGSVNLADLRAVVQRVLDRLVVVRFAEDHLVIPAGTLYSLYQLRATNPYTFTLSEFFQKLYQRFDQDHNSALFTPELADKATFSDEVLGGLVQKLYEARYRAMSADIMGNTYEQYLGKTLAQSNGDVITVDNLETRKKQGSYYTPQVIVRYLVDNSLGRYLYATADGQPDGELLPNERRKTALDIRELRVLDPACGSGSFLICAYQVLADFYQDEIKRLEAEQERRHAELVKQGVTTPLDIRIELSPWRAEIERLQDYPRFIFETHLYGVDLDPQAAEIATVNLIMRAMAGQITTQKRLPLILNQNIKVGNSLIGAGPTDPRYADHVADLAELRRLRLQLAAEANGSDHEDTLKAIEEIAGRVNAALSESLAEHFQDVNARRPFNWAVEFPEAFLDEEGQHQGEAAGFDVVIGNPPWEVVKPDLREFYAQFDPDIESRFNRRQVERRIAELKAEDPGLEAAWEIQKAKVEETSAYLRRSPDYTRQGRGDTATHKLFLERAYGLLCHDGRLDFVIPAGIYRDLGTQPLREMLLKKGQILYVFSFSNERFFFLHVDHRFQFTLLGAQKGTQSDGFWAAFRFNPRVAIAPKDLPTFLADSANLIYVKLNSLSRFSPDSLSVMEFQSQQDADVTGKIYSDWPVIGDELEGQWCMRLNREFDMTNDRALFNQSGIGYPLYEGKMIHQFDAHYAEPRYWVSKENAARHFREKKSSTDELDYVTPRLGFREIARPTDSRTLIATILPPETCCNHKITVASPRLSTYQFGAMLFSLAILNSFVLDFVVRFKVSSGVSMFHFYQLPMPRLTYGNPYFNAIVPRVARLTCTTPDFAELWQEVMSEPWNESKCATDPTERQVLRDELDALIAHLYRLAREDFAHILGTFPLVFPNNEAGQAKKEALLTIYDRFAEEGHFEQESKWEAKTITKDVKQ